jgi:glycosyltransferase involved in cell wall biosynthesis
VLVEGKELPANLREEVHDGARATWIEWMRNARVVVIPIRAGVISSPGISTIMDAMALKKCVVITEGPATHGIIDGQALTVPPADPAALAATISRAWNDHRLRDAVATRARQYALAQQGEQRLHTDLMRVVARTVLGDAARAE